MTAQRNNCEAIFAFLRSNNFHFSETWVIECVNYFKSTKPGISLEELKKEVKQQWLLLNLRDIKVPSLPPDLKSKKEIIINRNFAVQVESMIDSSRSCYSQFQKLLKVNLDHVETNEESEKSNRCLTFLITDGVQELHAMEYEIIKQIKTNDPALRPGFKMVIRGPVECRKGMILLKDENVRLCGGEVESLIVTNSLRNILIRRLELDPGDYPEVTSGHTAENEIPQPLSNQTGSMDNFEDGFVESLLSQDDEVFFNVPLQPVHQESQSAESGVHHVREDINTWSEGDLNHKNSVPIVSESTLFEANMPRPGSQESLDSELIGSSGSFSKPQNLIELDGDMDVLFEDYVEPQRNLQISASNLREPVQKKLTSFFKNSDSIVDSAQRTVVDSQKPTFVSYKPFVYLKHILSSKLSKPTIFIIKAIVLTLKKKLTIEKDTYRLKANITDGSSSVDVDFCSEILETFLGYSPCEMTVMIKAKQTNSAIADRVKESFSKAQEKLISLNCLMEIKFFMDDRSPLVLSLKEVTAQTLTALKERKLMDM